MPINRAPLKGTMRRGAALAEYTPNAAPAMPIDVASNDKSVPDAGKYTASDLLYCNTGTCRAEPSPKSKTAAGRRNPRPRTD
jgi:hypothetical protein